MRIPFGCDDRYPSILPSSFPFSSRLLLCVLLYLNNGPCSISFINRIVMMDGGSSVGMDCHDLDVRWTYTLVASGPRVLKNWYPSQESRDPRDSSLISTGMKTLITEGYRPALCTVTREDDTHMHWITHISTRARRPNGFSSSFTHPNIHPT